MWFTNEIEKLIIPKCGLRIFFNGSPSLPLNITALNLQCTNVTEGKVNTFRRHLFYSLDCVTLSRIFQTVNRKKGHDEINCNCPMLSNICKWPFCDQQSGTTYYDV